ncbi:MAG: META domain-containing protein [Usitatibacter sp.]
MNRGRNLMVVGTLVLAGCAAVPGSAPEASKEMAQRPATVLAESLVGTRWVGVVEGNPDPRMLPRLEFVREGRLTGFTGCNMMNGVWSLDSGEVHVGPVATTKRGCVGPEGQIESRLASAMGGRVTREGAKLVFTGNAGDRFEFIPAQAS